MVLNRVLRRTRSSGLEWPIRTPRRYAVLLTFMPVVLSPVLVGCKFHAARQGADSGSARSQQLTESLESEPWGQPKEVLARVNGRPITRGEFYLRVLRRFGTMKLLSGVIKEELFLQEAERVGISVSREEAKQKVDSILAAMAQQAGGERALEEQYRQEGLSMRAVRHDLEREVSTQLLIAAVTKSQRQISELSLEAYYQETYRYRRHIMRQIVYTFGPEAEGAGDKLETFRRSQRTVERLRQGADFALIARTESDDPASAPNGGMVGPVHKETKMKVPEFRAPILALKAGEVSDPIENPLAGAYHIFQVIEVIESENFADCREKMRRELENMEPSPRESENVLRILQERASIDLLGSPFIDAPDPPLAELPGGGAVPAAAADANH